MPRSGRTPCLGTLVVVGALSCALLTSSSRSASAEDLDPASLLRSPSATDMMEGARRARLLDASHAEEVGPALHAIVVGDGSPALRSEAILALGSVRYRPAIPDVTAALRDPSWRVRGAAVTAFRYVREPLVFYTLIARLADRSPWVQKCALNTLAEIGDPDAVRYVAIRLRSDRPDIRALALRTLKRIGGPRAIRALRAYAEASGLPLGDQVRAISAMSTIEHPSRIAALGRLLEDPREEVRLAAIEALSRIGDPAALPYVRQRLRGFERDGVRFPSESSAEVTSALQRLARQLGETE